MNDMAEKESPIKNNLRHIMMQIRDAASRVGRDPSEITLVGVSKRQSVERMQDFLDLCRASGIQAVFGENYVQEFIEKEGRLSGDYSAHFIGLLQSNKAKIAVAHFDLIQSCHTEKLLSRVNTAAGLRSKIQDVLLQVNISDDDAKGGFSASDIFRITETSLSRLENLKVKGLMTITRFYEDPELVRPDFKRMAELHQEVKERLRGINNDADQRFELSMGMSSDFAIAVEEGATMVRIGTHLFGARS